jgi:glycerophosphoryl diester phosphodiesterase
MISLLRVIGHRGAAGHAPENTLAGLKAAAGLGARCVEFDVKLTYDGELVLVHDDTVDRTTDGTGRVADLSLDEIRRLDAGLRFAPEFRGERIPTLAEAVNLAAELGLAVNIEIKPSSGQEAETGEGLGRALARDWPAGRHPPLVTSFRPAALERLRAVAPWLPRGLLIWERPPDWLPTARRLGCRALNASHQHLDRDLVMAAKAAGLLVGAYTVNDAARAAEIAAWGVDAVITDVPDRILATLGGR